MADEVYQGVGKCRESHLGSFGFPTRPPDPYEFCPECGNRMVWTCPSCSEPLPDDPKELESARFCRHCGVSYFGEERPAEATT
jgi:hypothetical protein